MRSFQRICLHQPAILTNDRTSSPQTIVGFYNKPGTSEHIFNEMGNDFSWLRLPCSFQSQNTAFMILAGIIAGFYRYLIGELPLDGEGIFARLLYFYHLYYLGRTFCRNRLQQKMNMIGIRPYLQKIDVIPLFYFHIYLFQGLINLLGEYHTLYFTGRTK